jgi:hypothetical protein
VNRVVLYLNDQERAKADDVRMAGAATHIEENGSAQPADRIAVELKKQNCVSRASAASLKRRHALGKQASVRLLQH